MAALTGAVFLCFLRRPEEDVGAALSSKDMVALVGVVSIDLCLLVDKTTEGLETPLPDFSLYSIARFFLLALLFCVPVRGTANPQGGHCSAVTASRRKRPGFSLPLHGDAEGEHTETTSPVFENYVRKIFPSIFY